jgi:hypothetical protein
MLRDTLAHLWGTVSGSRRRAEEAEAQRRAEEAEAKRRAETSNIHDACWSGDLKVVEVLLHGQPELVTSTNERGATPLHYAAARSQRYHRDTADRQG